MKTNTNRLIASAIETLERRVCMSDAAAVTPTAFGSTISQNVYNIVAQWGEGTTVTVSETPQGLTYFATRGTTTGTWVLYDGTATIQLGKLTVVTAQSPTVNVAANVLFVRTVQLSPQEQNDPAPTPKKNKAAKNDPAPTATPPDNQAEQSESNASAVVSAMPRTQIIDSGERSSRATSSVELVMSRGEEMSGRFIPTTTPTSPAPLASSTFSDTPLLGQGTVLGAAGTSVFALGATIAPVADVIDEVPAMATAALGEVQAIPQQAFATVTNALATVPPRYFGYAPLNLPYTLVADSIAAFADRSASLSAAVVADARVGGPWTLTAGVLAADLVAIAYIHRRRWLKRRHAVAWM